MRTNLEKWEYYLSIIRDKENIFIKNNTKNIPDKIFEISLDGSIRTLNVNGVRYFSYYNYSGKKPTKIEVAELKRISETDSEYSIEKIRIHWECISNGMKSSSAIKYIELDKYCVDEDEANEIANVKLLKRKREEVLLKHGHIRCTYCNKVVPGPGVKCKIIFQNSRQDFHGKWKKFVDEKTNIYCSNKCGGYDQMAHEG